MMAVWTGNLFKVLKLLVWRILMSEKKMYKYIPDRVSHPGETLLELLEERGMTQVELGERMGRPLKTINEIIKGKAAITPETAIQLERVFGVPNDFWNQNEA